MTRRVAFFLPKLTAGGVERNTLRIARALATRGYVVDIVVAESSGELIAAVPPGVSLTSLGIRLGNGGLFRSLIPLRRYIVKSRPEIVFSAMVQANIVALLAVRLANPRPWIVVSERTTMSQKAMNNWKKRALKLGVQLLYKTADRVHAVSDGVAAEFEAWSGFSRGRIKVIYNPVVDEDLYIRSQEDTSVRARIGSGVALIVAAGRLTLAKDYPTLIRAFQKTSEKVDCHLIILGEGSEREALESLVAELELDRKITLYGYCSNPYPIIAVADVFVLSSAWEGFPTVLVEALALGTYVVSTDCKSGPSEIINSPEVGALVPVGDSEALAEALIEAVNERRSIRSRTDRAKRAHELAEASNVACKYIDQLFPNNY